MKQPFTLGFPQELFTTELLQKAKGRFISSLNGLADQFVLTVKTQMNMWNHYKGNWIIIQVDEVKALMVSMGCKGVVNALVTDTRLCEQIVWSLKIESMVR